VRGRLFSTLFPGLAGVFWVCVVVSAGDSISPPRLVPVSVQASSSEKEEFDAEKVIDGDPRTRWSSSRSDREWITIDLGAEKTIGKIVLVWETACADMYQIQASQDGETWYVIHVETGGKEGRKEIATKPINVRYIRMYGLKRKTDWGYSLYAFDAYPAEEDGVPPGTHYKTTSTYRYDPHTLQPRTFFLATADIAPEGYYPIWLGNEQGFWTITGTERGWTESLICEDGTIEPYRRSWSLMPYLYLDGRLVTAQDAKLSQSLADGYLPIPSVRWEYDGLVFDQTMFTAGEEHAEVTYVVYELRNQGTVKKQGRLFVTFRPFQVTPSWQGDGGMVDIFKLELKHDPEHGLVRVNGKDLWRCLTPPDRVGAVTYLEGEVMDYISRGDLPPHEIVRDPWGGATGALEYEFALPPGGVARYLFAAPLDTESDVLGLTREAVSRELATTRDFWTELLNRIKIDVPDRHLVNVYLSNIAYILINRDGPVLQPGSRNYERSWIRDSALIGVALLRSGYAEVVKDYINWISDHQLFNGDVPCMINADGSMRHWGKTWPEYDGQGAYITLVAEYYKFTKDRDLLERRFPNVVKALEFLVYLRNKRLTDEYKNATDERARFYGILPLSVSHEGYSLPGKHSYWDDFLALKGWREAIRMAEILGKDDLIPWMKEQEAGLRKCLYASIDLVQEQESVKYIPGCAELGEFDACSPAIAFWPTEEYKSMPKEEALYTLEKYYDEIMSPRLAGDFDMDSGYVPYEMKQATSFLIMRQKQRTLEILRHFLTVTRPKYWNHWAEVIYYDYRKPGYIGDMPHSWAGADYMNAVRTMFVLEEEDRLTLGLGIDEKWLDRDEGISIESFPTHYGRINYSIVRHGNKLAIEVTGDMEAPAGGYVFRSPLAAPIKAVSINGEEWNDFTAEEIRFGSVPAAIGVVY